MYIIYKQKWRRRESSRESYVSLLAYNFLTFLPPIPDNILDNTYIKNKGNWKKLLWIGPVLDKYQGDVGQMATHKNFNFKNVRYTDCVGL